MKERKQRKKEREKEGKKEIPWMTGLAHINKKLSDVSMVLCLLTDIHSTLFSQKGGSQVFALLGRENRDA